MSEKSPEFQIMLDHIYKTMREHIQERTLTPPNVAGTSRFRYASILVSDQTVTETKERPTFPTYDLYEEALQRISIDLQQGFGPTVNSAELFDHQARDWALFKIEELHSGAHRWCPRLKELDEAKGIFAYVVFGFSSIPSTPEEDEKRGEIAVLPRTYIQLVDYSDPKHPDGNLLDAEGWDLQRDGVIISREALMDLGRSTNK